MKTKVITVTGNLYQYDESADKKLNPYLDDGYMVKLVGHPIVTEGKRDTWLTQTFVLEKFYQFENSQ